MDRHEGFHRIAVSPAGARIRIELEGEPLADSDRALVLREGSLPPRYYLPLDDVRTELLEPTDTTTTCPFKGDARYWSVRVGDDVHADLAWSYADPIEERREIAGLVAFYDERVDVLVDGVAQERPVTPWSPVA